MASGPCAISYPLLFAAREPHGLDSFGPHCRAQRLLHHRQKHGQSCFKRIVVTSLIRWLRYRKNKRWYEVTPGQLLAPSVFFHLCLFPVVLPRNARNEWAPFTPEPEPLYMKQISRRSRQQLSFSVPSGHQSVPVCGIARCSSHSAPSPGGGSTQSICQSMR